MTFSAWKNTLTTYQTQYNLRAEVLYYLFFFLIILNTNFFLSLLQVGGDLFLYFFTLKSLQGTILIYILNMPLLFLIPFLLIYAIPNIFNWIYLIALGNAAISFFLSILLLLNFDLTQGFQNITSYASIPVLEHSFLIGIDGLSLFFIALTNLFICFCILNITNETPYAKEKLFFLFLLQWSVLGSFILLDFIGFFVFFELSLIPIYFLVLGWGSRERRIRAGFFISLYTMFGSMFMFFSILYICSKAGTSNYLIILNECHNVIDILFSEKEQTFLWIFFFLSFAAKIPTFPLHIWLPEAHVEAPTIGSVLLAVLLLKLGTYGLLRFSLPIFLKGTLFFSAIVVTLALLSILVSNLVAISQIDLKKIIAYSSIGHMNVVLLGLITQTAEGIWGGIFQMLSHGIVSGALFFGVGVMYDRYSIRSLKYVGGLSFLYPMFAVVFLIFSMANISFPLTSGFVGEFLIFMGVFAYNFFSTLISALSIILGAIYTLWTYNRVFFGNIKIKSLFLYKDLTNKEFYMFKYLIIILLWAGIASAQILDYFVGLEYNIIGNIT